MARAAFNKPITAFRGILGDLVFRQKNEGRAGSRALHFRSHTAGEGQSKQGRHVRKASVYENEVGHLHPVYAELAKALNLTPYNVALSDRMNPPVIHRILVRDNKILVQASDNVMVARLEVTILDEAGEILEQGEAIRLQGDWWEYVPECAGKTITAAAWDLAGNVAKAEL
jgi:hypothetical protein